MSLFVSRNELYNWTVYALSKLCDEESASEEEVKTFFQQLGKNTQFVKDVRQEILFNAKEGRWAATIHILAPVQIIAGFHQLGNLQLVYDLFEKIGEVRITNVESDIGYPAIWVTVMWS